MINFKVLLKIDYICIYLIHLQLLLPSVLWFESDLCLLELSSEHTLLHAYNVMTLKHSFSNSIFVQKISCLIQGQVFIEMNDEIIMVNFLMWHVKVSGNFRIMNIKTPPGDF